MTQKAEIDKFKSKYEDENGIFKGTENEKEQVNICKLHRSKSKYQIQTVAENGVITTKV